jgi:hypothetical protein
VVGIHNLDDPIKQLGDTNYTTYSISTTKSQERANTGPSKNRVNLAHEIRKENYHLHHITLVVSATTQLEMDATWD